MSAEVRLSMPADPEFLRLARVTAMGLASRLSFTFDEIEDLRIAIDELCFTVVGPKGRPGTLELEYEIIPGGIRVTGSARVEEPVAEARLSDLSELILAAVADEHEVRNDGGTPSFRLVKCRGEDG